MPSAEKVAGSSCTLLHLTNLLKRVLHLKVLDLENGVVRSRWINDTWEGRNLTASLLLGQAIQTKNTKDRIQ